MGDETSERTEKYSKLQHEKIYLVVYKKTLDTKLISRHFIVCDQNMGLIISYLVIHLFP